MDAFVYQHRKRTETLKTWSLNPCREVYEEMSSLATSTPCTYSWLNTSPQTTGVETQTHTTANNNNSPSSRVNVNVLSADLMQHIIPLHFRAPLSLQKMRKLNMRVSEAAIKTLQHLGLVEVDRKGSVSLSSSHWGGETDPLYLRTGTGEQVDYFKKHHYNRIQLKMKNKLHYFYV